VKRSPRPFFVVIGIVALVAELIMLVQEPHVSADALAICKVILFSTLIILFVFGVSGHE